MPGLRVLAGPSVESLEPISALVNQNKPFEIKSDAFEGTIVVNIKGFAGSDECDYFARPERQGITWSIQVQGTFACLHPFDPLDDDPLHRPVLELALIQRYTLWQHVRSSTGPSVGIWRCAKVHEVRQPLPLFPLHLTETIIVTSIPR